MRYLLVSQNVNLVFSCSRAWVSLSNVGLACLGLVMRWVWVAWLGYDWVGGLACSRRKLKQNGRPPTEWRLLGSGTKRIERQAQNDFKLARHASNCNGSCNNIKLTMQQQVH